MKIVPLTPADERAIRDWPGYPGRFAVFDYALGRHGWLVEYPDAPDNHRFAAWDGAELVGFSILAGTGPGEAEFYIAIRADRTARGHGRELTAAVLRAGFTGLGLRRIHLKVRSWHKAAVHLYASLGFAVAGETDIVIHGQTDRFVLMETFGPPAAA